MSEFVAHTEIAAPIDRVFGFHEQSDALERLSPTFPPLRVLARSGGIEVGGRVSLRIGGLVRWDALHTALERPVLFVDEQQRGPFARWVHRHEFEDIDGHRTRLTDRITYELPGGRIINTLLAPFVRLGLARMFAHRHQVTRRACE